MNSEKNPPKTIIIIVLRIHLGASFLKVGSSLEKSKEIPPINAIIPKIESKMPKP